MHLKNNHSPALKKKKKLHSLAAVDDDVSRPDAPFEHAHLRMVSTTAEQARRLNAEVSDTLPVVVHDAEAVLLQEPLILLLYFLQRAVKKKKHIRGRIHKMLLLVMILFFIS